MNIRGFCEEAPDFYTLGVESKVLADARYSTFLSSDFQSIEQLSHYIDQRFDDEFSKSLSIYIWLSDKLTYDNVPSTADNVNVKQVFDSKTANCIEFSLLFNEIAKQVGLQSEAIVGYVRSGKVTGTPNHAWNAVRVNGNWGLLDVSWAAVRNSGNPDFKYFLADPNRFILDHLPEDPIWTLTTSHIPLQTFLEGGDVLQNYIQESQVNYDLKNKIVDEYHNLDSLGQMIEFLSRKISNSNKENEYGLALCYFNQAQEKLALISTVTTNLRRSIIDEIDALYEKSLHYFLGLSNGDTGYEYSVYMTKCIMERKEILKLYL